MRKPIVVLVLLLAVTASAAKSKNKVKQKSYEPWLAELAGYAGTYRGPSPAHILELQLSNGVLRGIYRENGRVARVSPLTLTGPEFSALAVFDDGSRRELRGSFAIRILNGERAVGLRLKDVEIAGMGPVNTFFVLVQ
jgi:hypothetical protein